MIHTRHRDWADAAPAATVDAGHTTTPAPVPAAAPHEGSEMPRSRLDYIRRYGAAMGLGLYELRASWPPLEDR